MFQQLVVALTHNTLVHRVEEAVKTIKDVVLSFISYLLTHLRFRIHFPKLEPQ